MKDEIIKSVLSYIGLATKGGNVVSGEFSTEKAIKENAAKLVIVATDASDNTKKMFRNMCSYREIALYEFATKEVLGHTMGKRYRASLAIIDEGLANIIEKRLRQEDE